MATVSYQYKVVRPEFTMDGSPGDQSHPDVAVAANGDIFEINLTPNGTLADFRVRYETSDLVSNVSAGLPGMCSDPATAALSNSEFVSVNVNSQANGMAGGTSILFGVNALPLSGASNNLGNQNDDQLAPDAAGLIGNRFVVV